MERCVVYGREGLYPEDARASFRSPTYSKHSSSIPSTSLARMAMTKSSCWDGTPIQCGPAIASESGARPCSPRLRCQILSEGAHCAIRRFIRVVERLIRGMGCGIGVEQRDGARGSIFGGHRQVERMKIMCVCATLSPRRGSCCRRREGRTSPPVTPVT